jgi:hypothetical protein
MQRCCAKMQGVLQQLASELGEPGIDLMREDPQQLHFFGEPAERQGMTSLERSVAIHEAVVLAGGVPMNDA